MRYATVCSGIEAPTAAWHSLGWEPQWFSEIEPFPSAVLAYHYPHVPNLGDMTRLHESEIFTRSTIALLCGGTPCQSFSVAGLRKGLADPRGNLMLTFLALADTKRPRWIVWENVPGVLSSNEGKDFGSFLGALAELGYGWAYRVLDAQYYGVAQRRRRVFVVGHLGDYRRAAAVLFERYSLSGHPAPSRKKREEVTQIAGTLTSNGGGLSRPAGNANELDFCVVDVAPTLRAGGNKTGGDRPPGTDVDTVESLVAYRWQNETSGIIQDDKVSTLRGNGTTTDERTVGAYVVPVYGIDEECNVSDNHFGPLLRGGQGGTRQSVAFGAQNSANQSISASEHIAPTLDKSKIPAVAFSQNIRDEVREMDVVGALAASPGMKQTSYIRQHMAVRRLTPIECERLQGFENGYTDIRPKGKPTPDGPRYKALGNSMAVPVIHWLGQRIQQVDNLTTTLP